MYEGDREGLEQLVERLSKRREIIRDLITGFRQSPRQPFPNWKDPVGCVRVLERTGAKPLSPRSIPVSATSARDGWPELSVTSKVVVWFQWWECDQIF
jgi:hypothetical protein